MYLVFEINDQKIRAASVEARSNMYIKDFIVEDLPDGVVSNGYIVRPTDLEAIVSGMLEKLPKVKECAFVVSSSDIYQKETKVPSAKKQVVNQIVKNELESVVGTSKDFVMDYMNRANVDPDESGLNTIFAYVAPLELTSGYKKLAAKLKLKVVGIDTSHSALNKALAGAQINGDFLDQETCVLVKMGRKNLSLYLLEKGQCVFNRQVLLSADEYEKALVENCNSSFEKIDLSPDKQVENFRAFNTILPMLNSVIEEIMRMQQFAYSRSHDRPVENVYIYGAVSEIKDLTEYLSSNLHMDVQKIRSISTLDIDNPKVRHADVFVLAGAGMGTGVNLANPPITVKVSGFSLQDSIIMQIPIILGWVAVLVVVIVGIAIYGGILNSRIDAANAKLEDPQFKSDYATAISKQAQVAVEANNVAFAQQQIDYHNSRKFLTGDLINKVIGSCPAGVKLYQISYSEGVLTVAGAGTSELNAKDFAVAMRKIETVKNVNYAGTTYNDEDKTYTFTMTVDLEIPQSEEETTAADSTEEATN